ncbi:MAG: farnesyl diphosphate synthase [Planctomycetales bacterium]
MEDSRTDIESLWLPLRTQINAALEQYLDLPADCPPRLREAMAYSLLAGGKRLRPTLVLMAAQACGGNPELALPAACALEMIHTYSLIHDDLPAMDDDDLRRGRPTNHVVYGEGMAILAGDALLTLAFEIMARDLPPAVAAPCCADLANAAGAVGMVAGQVADLAAEHRPPNLEELQAIHRRKTGRLLCSALTLGARVAQAPPETLTRLEKYGQCLGLAFQITDDLLDVQGDTQTLGKQAGKDSAHGKMTYPALMGIENSRNRAEQLIDEAIHSVLPLGEAALPLLALARFVLERDH